MKRLVWIGSSREDLKGMRQDVMDELGYELYKLQCGNDPLDFKPMPSVGKGVYEIRIRDENNKNTIRCFYLAKLKDKICVLHCFIKKTEQTSKKDIEIGKKRYSEAIKNES